MNKRNEVILLKYINFKDLFLWDVKRFSAQKIKSQYPIVKLGDYITEENHKVKLKDYPDSEFGILGVNNKTGIFDAYTVKGSETKQAYKKMDVGWIAYNPYRINVGSIGIRTKEHKNNYISPAYVVYSCKEELLPDFVFKLLTTHKYKRLIRENTTGAVRQTLSFDVLKTLDIPLPSFNKQMKIMEKYYKKLDDVKELISQINNIEDKIEDTITRRLHIIYPSNNLKSKRLSIIRFTELKRWDVWTESEIGFSNIFDNGYLNDVVLGKPMYGAGEKSVNTISDIRYIRITDINDDGSLNEDIVSAERVDSKYMLSNNDFLIARSGNTVGKTFLYKESYGKAIFAGYLVKYVLNLDKVIPEYLLIFSKCRMFRNWICVNQRISGQPNINGQEYLNASIVIPPLNVQKELVDNVLTMKNKITKLKKQIEQNHKDALINLEKEVLNIED